MTRRDLIRIAGSGILLSSLPSSLRAIGPRNSSSGRTRLFFDLDELDQIRANTRSPLLAQTYDEWTKITISDFRAAFSAFQKSGDIIYDFAKIIDLLTKLSLVQLVDPQANRRDALLEGINKLIAFDKWDYFLDGDTPIGIQRASLATVRILFAREVLEEAIDELTDKMILRAVAEKGCLPCYRTVYGMDHPDTVTAWRFDDDHAGFYDISMDRWPMILGDNNLRSAPGSALGIGALALRGFDPRAELWLDTAVASAKRVLRLFSPDGSYFEGLSYVGYTLRTALNFFDAHSRNGGDIDWAREANFDGMLDYIATMQMGKNADGSPDIVNFSDARASVFPCIPAWIGRETSNPFARYTADNLSNPGLFLDFLWYRPAGPTAPPPERLKNVHNDLDWVICRTGWKANDAVLAFRSGGPCNHEHADRNHITFKVYGERLLTDLFGAAYDKRQPGWAMRHTAAHNSVLVDGKGNHYHDGSEGTNDSKSYANILEFEDQKEIVWWTSDATAAYLIDNDHISKVLRTVIFAKPNIVVVLDQVRLHFGPQSMEARYFPDNRDGLAKISTAGTEFTIDRPNAQLHGNVFSGNPFSVTSRKLDVPSETGDFPCVAITSPPAFTHEVLTLLRANQNGQEPSRVKVNESTQAWTIEGTNFNLTINTERIVPAVRID